MLLNGSYACRNQWTAIDLNSYLETSNLRHGRESAHRLQIAGKHFHSTCDKRERTDRHHSSCDLVLLYVWANAKNLRESWVIRDCRTLIAFIDGSWLSKAPADWLS